jgi:carboxyl-terminal processing protease
MVTRFLMRKTFTFKLVMAGLMLSLASCSTSQAPPATISAEGKTEGNIARLAARILEQSQYTRHPIDEEISAKFLDRYIEQLDGQHLTFLQSDLEELAPYRASLGELIKMGNITPAYMIYDRYLHRLEERVDYTAALLKNDTFDFEGQDNYTVERRDLPRPLNPTEARQLWRQRLRYEYLQEKLNNRPPGEIVRTLTKRYSSLLHTARDAAKEDVLEIYLSALSNAYDPHSDYLGRTEYDTLSIEMRLSLFGIGAELTSENGYPKIARILPGPAARSKQLKPGDRIIAVAQNGKEPLDVIDVPIAKVADMIRGPKGTQVRLTVIPADATDPSLRKTVALIREEIKLEDKEAKASIIEMPDDKGRVMRLGVLDLPSFYEDMDGRGGLHHKSTTDDVSRLLKKLKGEKVSGLILDLRQNGGGSLDEAINLTSLFIKKGPVVQIKDAKGKISVGSDKNSSMLYDGPLIVLVSRFSASASEILAGALQDYDRALIVGDASTFGKGTVQSVLELAPLMRRVGLGYDYNPGGLLVTVQKFYRPGGSSTQLRGVASDIALPTLSGIAEVGEASLFNPLPWDQIRTAKFEKWNWVRPWVGELRQRSARRVENDPDFAYLREDIARLKKSLAEKTVSLNESQRRQQLQDAKARLTARKEERQRRAMPNWKTFEVTLENIDQPSRPSPVGRTNTASTAELRHLLGDMDEESILSEEFADGMVPAVDVILQEAERILADYVALSVK